MHKNSISCVDSLQLRNNCVFLFETLIELFYTIQYDITINQQPINLLQTRFYRGPHLQQKVRFRSMPSEWAEVGMFFQVQPQKKSVQQQMQNQQLTIYNTKYSKCQRVISCHLEHLFLTLCCSLSFFCLLRCHEQEI